MSPLKKMKMSGSKDKVIQISMNKEPDSADGTKVSFKYKNVFMPMIEAKTLSEYYTELEKRVEMHYMNWGTPGTKDTKDE